jgi:UDP-glucose 4-epimerase
MLRFKRVVFMSSQVVYGRKKYEPVDEGHPTYPLTPYGVYKLTGEHLGFNYCDLYGVDFIALRFGHGYGRELIVKNAPQMIVENAVRGIPTKWEAGGDFQTDYVYVKDAVQGILLALDAKGVNSRVFNIMSGEYLKISQIADLVKELIPKAQIEIGSGITEPQRLLGDGPYSIERAVKELGYQPQYDMRKGLSDLVSSYEK